MLTYIKMEIEWTNEMAIRLIQKYKEKPELWDSTHDLFRVQTAKYEAWSELSMAFDGDIADLRKKLNSIFASHRREKAKVRAGGRSTWFLYNHLKFLPTHLDHDTDSPDVAMNPAAESSHADLDDESEASTSSEDEDVDKSMIIKQEPLQESKKHKNLIYKQKTQKSKLRSPVRRRFVKDNVTSKLDTTDARLLETLNLLRKSDLSKRKDECDSFGEYIAISLRKHDRKTQSMIKQAINNILFEQEMKKYNSANQYTVVISNIDENPLLVHGGSQGYGPPDGKQSP